MHGIRHFCACRELTIQRARRHPDYQVLRLATCRVTVDDGLSQKIATLAGVGISMNSIWSVHRENADGELVRVLPDYEINDRAALWLVYPKSNVLTAKVRAFIDFLIDRVGRSPAWQ